MTKIVKILKLISLPPSFQDLTKKRPKRTVRNLKLMKDKEKSFDNLRSNLTMGELEEISITNRR